MKKKYIEWKLNLIDKEIDEWRVKENKAMVSLKKCKEKQWELIELLERYDKEYILNK